jgi:hypothetical protein
VSGAAEEFGAVVHKLSRLWTYAERADMRATLFSPYCPPVFQPMRREMHREQRVSPGPTMQDAKRPALFARERDSVPQAECCKSVWRGG